MNKIIEIIKSNGGRNIGISFRDIKNKKYFVDVLRANNVMRCNRKAFSENTERFCPENLFVFEYDGMRFGKINANPEIRLFCFEDYFKSNEK